MTVNDIKNTYLTATGKVSDYTRSINYSAIAMVWVLCDQNLGKIGQFKSILACFFISLICDYFQYLWKAIVVWLQYKSEDNKVNQDENSEVRYWGFIQFGSWTFFIAKVVAAIFGSYYLLSLLWKL